MCEPKSGGGEGGDLLLPPSLESGGGRVPPLPPCSYAYGYSTSIDPKASKGGLQQTCLQDTRVCTPEDAHSARLRPWWRQITTAVERGKCKASCSPTVPVRGSLTPRRTTSSQRLPCRGLPLSAKLASVHIVVWDHDEERGMMLPDSRRCARLGRREAWRTAGTSG